MSDPKNHHWLPQFLQREWCSDYPGKVLCFRRPFSDVKFSWPGIKTLGATEWLYTTRWTGYDNSNFLETDFMTKAIDTPAASIHQRMLHGDIQQLGFEERQLWSCFMLLLMQRHPEAIRPKQEIEEQKSKKFWIEYLTGQTPTGHTQPLDRADAEAFYDQHFSGSGHDLVLQALVNFPLTSPFLLQIMNLEWRVMRLHDSAVYFFLADNPIIMWGKGDIQRLWMPLSFDALFVAGDNRYFSETPTLREEFRECLALEVMRHQFQRAREFVIGKAAQERINGIVKIAERYLVKPSGGG